MNINKRSLYKTGDTMVTVGIAYCIINVLIKVSRGRELGEPITTTDMVFNLFFLALILIGAIMMLTFKKYKS